MNGIRARFKLDYPGFSLDVDLDLPGTGVTALFGHSGSGKTTLLRCVAGLQRAVDGELVVNGAVWQDATTTLPTHQRAIGYVFQEASLFPHLDIRRNLEYGLRRVPEARRRVGLEHAIGLLGIGHLLGRKPDSLSGGERQRVGIARALVVSPDLLLLDEPLAALDQARKREILPYLERLHDDLEIPVLYVSHAPDEVARLADHLVVLEQGRVVASGGLTETLARLDLPIHLGEDAGVVLAGEVMEIDGNWHLARVRVGCGLPEGHTGGPVGLWVRDGGHPVGHRARVRILARDVSVALGRHDDSSILNTLSATVVEVADDTHPALALVRLDVSGAPLVARLTRRSVAGLGLHAGKLVWAQIKAVALVG